MLDITIVVLALPLLLPCAAVVALAVFLDSPGPVIYRSQRVGKGGLVFEMLKFRTMARDAEGPPLSAAGDERYTPLGRRLALSRLDELPQIWNVLKGVPPGLTGPAQVEYAWEGEVLARAQAVDRARVYRESILPYKLEIDLEYVNRHGVLSDIALLARTLVLPLHQIGVRLVEGLPGRSFEPATAGLPSQGVRGFVEHAVEALEEADAIVAELQDSMRPVEVGDAELRAGLAEVRELIAAPPERARRFLSLLGR